MKKGVLLFLLVGVLSLAVCYGEVRDIAYIHENFDDLKEKEVNIKGVVTAKFRNNLIVIQDETAGIWLWSKDKGKFKDVKIGDEIDVIGRVTVYDGLREIEVTKIKILSHNNPLPDPKVVEIKDIKDNKSLMGTLVKLCKVEVIDVDGKKFRVKDRTGEIEGYFKYSNYLTLKVGDVINLTAVVGCYKNRTQVYPRGNEDIVVCPNTAPNTSKDNKSSNVSQNYGNIFFIHLGDIHLCGNDEVSEVFGGTVPPVTTTKEAVKEVIRFQPEVVVQTGDIVALADKYNLDTGERWYKLVNTTVYTPIKEADIPFLFAPGNHDPAGIKLDNVDKSDPRYGDRLLLKYLLSDKNRTYYSYDHGNYHFVIVDPVETEESGYRAVRLPEEQLEWLKSDLENSRDKFIIICYHQPLGSWEDDSYRKFLDTVSPYREHILIVAGHTHDNRLLTIEGVPEHQGGAVCGDWWQTGKTPDGNPMGYVIYHIENGTIYRFYKGIGHTEQINLLAPRDVVLSNTTSIDLNVYYENKTVVNITYMIDNEGTLHPLNFTLINITKTWWYNAKGDIVITSEMLDDKKHNITIIVTAMDNSTFNRTFHYKFSNNTIMKIAEIIDDTNFKDYYGLFAVINGTITTVTRDGNLLQVVDDSGEIVIWAGDCKHDNFTPGQKVILRGQITEFRGTKELKLIRGSDVKVYGFENISVSLIVLPDIETAYKNFSKLKNRYVEARGVATAVFGDLIAIQDDTRGIEVWLGEIKHDPIKLGDVVTVRGQLTTYNNMIEIIVGKEDDLIINGSAPVPAPKEITINEIPDNLGNLVIVKGLTVKSADNRKIIVSDGTNTTIVYCKRAGFNPTEVVKIGDKIDVIGIAHLYKEYYEILPRSEEDIIFSTGDKGKIITLKKGWNTISIPHRANISFSDPEAVGSIITYYNSTWHNVSNLEPLYGYYIYCHNNTQMNIKYITPEDPRAPPQRPVYKGWNLVGVNPGKNDVNGVSLIDFILPVEDSWIMIIDLDGNVYDKNDDNLSSVLLQPYDVYWMYCKKDDILAGRGLN